MTTQAPTDKQLLDALRESEMGRTIREQGAAAALAERQQQADALAALLQEKEETVPPLRQASAEGQERFEKADRAFTKARAQRQDAQYALEGALTQYAKSIRDLQAPLLASAPPKIDAFFRQVDDLRLRNPGNRAVTDAKSVVHRLHFEALTDAELDKRIAEIKANLSKAGVSVASGDETSGSPRGGFRSVLRLGR